MVEAHSALNVAKDTVMQKWGVHVVSFRGVQNRDQTTYRLNLHIVFLHKHRATIYIFSTQIEDVTWTSLSDLS